MSKRQFAATVGAYLTGWVIAQAIFNRVRHYVWDRDGYDVKDEIATFVAERLVSALETRDGLEEQLVNQRREVRRLTSELTAARIALSRSPRQVAYALAEEIQQARSGGRQQNIGWLFEKMDDLCHAVLSP